MNEIRFDFDTEISRTEYNVGANFPRERNETDAEAKNGLRVVKSVRRLAKSGTP